MSDFGGVFDRMIDTLEEQGETKLVDRAQQAWHDELEERDKLHELVYNHKEAVEKADGTT